MSAPASISIKRTHGLGNLVMLLPIADALAKRGAAVHLVTRPEWHEAMQAGRPGVTFSTAPREDTIDLDAATAALPPSMHRTLEFARLLSVPGPFEAPRLHVPESWSGPFRRYAGALVVAPESGHPARSWPAGHVHELLARLAAERVVLTGLSSGPALPCAADLRGRLSLPQLLGLLAHARAVICFDSGVLHLAAACLVPTLAIFGGIDPAFRIFPGQRVRVIQAALDCCPCNKAETCAGSYPCLSRTTPGQVLAELATIEQVGGREIKRMEQLECTG
ncbi:glycosyltransferase family 9 protein [Trinickia terrae]|uniref:Glycosyltransferase family 9 protein n=1 Tax=Trinickia terrae TaxID=2571161 RepID=A0A4U1I282_9BURK|nr:glycosyltransferase family 9 protein [Trinickia terrae]TKC87282.1 glycosyltransferase family 9 protein [Trinickia terrae]